MNPLHCIVFIPAVIFLLIPWKNHSLLILRHLVALYFIFLLTDRASGYFFEWTLFSHRLYLSASLPIAACSLPVYWFSRSNTLRQSASLRDPGIKSAWILTLALLILHILFLLALLQSFYGYGWQHSFSVLGRFIFFLFLFLCFWRVLHYFWLRISLVTLVVVNFFLLNLSGAAG